MNDWFIAIVYGGFVAAIIYFLIKDCPINTKEKEYDHE